MVKGGDNQGQPGKDTDSSQKWTKAVQLEFAARAWGCTCLSSSAASSNSRSRLGRREGLARGTRGTRWRCRQAGGDEQGVVGGVTNYIDSG